MDDKHAKELLKQQGKENKDNTTNAQESHDNDDNDENNENNEKLVLVFDLGGGTFDVSLLSIEDGFFEGWTKQTKK